MKKPKGKKRAYRIKLELDFMVMADEENKKIDRALVISLKNSQTYFDNFESEFLKELFNSEFEFFSDKGFGAMRELIMLLHRELIFNQAGIKGKPEREKFIKKSLAIIEKGIRQRLKGNRGRPKTAYSFFELLNSTDVDLFVADVLNAISEVEKEKPKITKTSVAEKLFPYNSNPLQAFNRKLKQFQITFEDI
ncbi:MAG: hypothetical protein ACR2J3_11210 [Aridibacter sp.]